VSDIVDLLPSAASTAAVTEAMVRIVLGVHPDMDIPQLMRLLVERGISGVPVVDPEGKPLGMVSKTDILRELCENPGAARGTRSDDDNIDAASNPELPFGPYAGRRVRHIMTPLTISVGENASIARAAAVMAYEKVHRVMVVDLAGNVVGIVSSIDVLRWLACHDGYAIP
jgi:predicted transcriptional regulator